jgi:acyl dehydratase
MAVSWSHALRQGPVLSAIARVGVASVRGGRPKRPAQVGDVVEATLAPRDPALVSDYVAHVGGTVARGTLPPHFYPQWVFPLFSELLLRLPYDLRKVLNGGARVVAHKPLPAGEPLHVRVRLEGIDDDGSRAIVHLVSVTGTASAPDAVEGHLWCFFPLKKREGKGAPKEPPVVPPDATELARWPLAATAGRDFALLTGDFNPIHWIPAAGRAAGFKGCILHGYASMARAWEGLTAQVYANDPGRLASLEVKFTRPVPLPGEVRLFLTSRPSPDAAGVLTMGTSPGAPANLTGTYRIHDPSPTLGA